MPASCEDEILSKLLAEIEDMNVKNVGHRRFVLVEEMLIQLCARHQLAPMQREKLQDDILARGQRNRLTL